MSPLMLDHVGMRGTPIGKRNMFAVTPAKLQDVRRLVDIEFHAFENERVNQVLSYRDYKKPAHFERSVRVYQNALLDSQTRSDRRDEEGRRGRANSRFESPRSNSRVNFKKVVDTEGSEIISFTKFEMKTYTKEEIMSAADSGHEGEPMMNRDWFALNERLRREYIGLAKHCYVGMLATEPKYQHNGAGTMLLEEILAEADDAGVEVYLEATDTAKAFYEKHGFEEIRELRFNPAEYGAKGLGTERQTVMVRGALGWGGQRKAVRSWDVAVAHAKADLQR